MLFASLDYLVFLPIVVTTYWLAPRRWRNLLLLVASYVFYMWFIPAYGLLIFALAVGNYLFGLWIARSSHPSRVLALGIALDLGVLAFFKYTNLLVTTAAGLLRAADWPTVNILLPLGISFFTFEFVHYIVDIRRGSVPIHDFTNFHLFASFFPSQIAGPIKRFQPFHAQLIRDRRFDVVLFEQGTWLIVRGLAKKVVLADHLGPIVASAFAPVGVPDTASAWIGIYAFALQIYFDFSGYTDIGRGSAQLLGFRLPENFMQPYFAVGFRDFWRRWHMSLSSWLRDYVYIPLGGSRRRPLRTAANLLATMTLGGMWHGAAWHFAVWGFFHGIGLVSEHLVTAVASAGRTFAASAIGRGVLALLTFHAVCAGWVLFRAPDLAGAERYLRALAGHGGNVVVPSGPVSFALGVYLVSVAAERFFPTVFGTVLGARAWPARAVAYAAIALATAILVPQTIERFIYFQF